MKKAKHHVPNRDVFVNPLYAVSRISMSVLCILPTGLNCLQVVPLQHQYILHSATRSVVSFFGFWLELWGDRLVAMVV